VGRIFSCFEKVKNGLCSQNNTWTIRVFSFIFGICIHEPGSSVCVVSGYGLDDRAIEVRYPAEAKDSSSSLCVLTGSVAHPAPCTMGIGCLFPRVKERPRRDADHSQSSIAEIENELELYVLCPQAPTWHVVEQL
jgi:hypothetical protein